VQNGGEIGKLWSRHTWKRMKVALKFASTILIGDHIYEIRRSHYVSAALSCIGVLIGSVATSSAFFEHVDKAVSGCQGLRS
jgi:hypothetical protein